MEVAWLQIPGALLSQLPVEVATTVSASSLVDVISQLPVEVATNIVAGDNPRTTQMVVEPVVVNTALKARTTQAVAEAVEYPTDEIARTTQAVVEVVWRGSLVLVLIETACFRVIQTEFPMVATPAN